MRLESAAESLGTIGMRNSIEMNGGSLSSLAAEGARISSGF